jgi:AcrR family transcriptional regulator
MTARARTQPRKLPRQSRAKATVDAIVVAAARILRDDGYERANVNRIADLAGVSVGSLYQYFPSKEALVAAVMARHNARMIDAFEDGLADLATLPLPDAVRGVVVRTLAAYGSDRELHRVIVQEVPKTGLLARTEEFQERMRQIITAYFEFRSDELRPLPAALATRILLTSVEAVASELACDREGRLDDPSVVGELTALVLGYIRR